MNNTSSSGTEGTYCFQCEWFDTQANIVRKYHLFYFPDQTIEMFDLKNRRTFLKRTPYPSITLKDLFIGNQITVYSRSLKLLSYADDYTKSRLEEVKGRTLAIVKPEAFNQIGKVIDSLYKNNFTIGGLRSCKLTSQQVSDFYGDKSISTNEIAGKLILALEVIGKDAQQQLSELTGVDAKESKDKNDTTGSRPSSRSGFSNSLKKNIHASNSQRTANMELSYFFNNGSISPTATFTNCTLGIIKPHAVQAGQAGQILSMIMSLSSLHMRSIQMITLDHNSSSEFLEVYQGVVPDYSQMVDQLASGPCIAFELCADNDKAVETFRSLCGPPDPEVARYIRPNTIRAKFGLSRIQNAIHCTDLSEDGPLESEFFFSILQKTKSV